MDFTWENLVRYLKHIEQKRDGDYLKFDGEEDHPIAHTICIDGYLYQSDFNKWKDKWPDR